MSTLRALFACSAVVAALAAVPVAAQEKPPIKVGAILPMTGFGATYGTLFHTGMALAVDEVNAAGGINGSKIQLMIEDDQLQATQSVLLFRKLVAENAVVILGPVSGTSWENCAPIANAMKTPAINYTALKPGISIKPYALRLHPADDTMIPEGVAEFVKKFPNAKRVVVTGDVQEASGSAGMQEFKKAAEKMGLQVLDVVGYQTRTTDFSPVVIKIRGLNPDAIFVSSLVPTTLPVVKELEAQRFDKPIVVNALVWAGNFIPAAGSAAANLYTIGYATNEPTPEDPKRNSYVQRYLQAAAKTNLPQPVNISNTSMAYDAVMLVADIMRQKKMDGTAKPEAVREAIKDALAALNQWQGINTLTMRDTGDGHIQSHLLKADVQKKEWVFALPQNERLNKPAL
jgi:branched-chain amino acid transport system substrate-binding protein